MANFYKDNDDIMFLVRHLDLGELARYQEEGFRFARECDYAPADAAEAIDNYQRILDTMGQISGNFIAPRSEGIDREGNTLNEDGTVSYAQGIRESMDALAKADVMGFTLPYRFGGINCPNLVYTMATEMVSRADAPLMNIFGLQGIAETINAFADEPIKQQYLHEFSAGKVTGAMVLTEPDAGSDLQSCKLRAFQDQDGNWYLHGVKRFITNGCGEVLLVMARRVGPESVRLRPRADGPRAASGRQARHPRFADLRAVFRQYAVQAHRRAAARPDNLCDGPDERGSGGDRGPVDGHRGGGLASGAGLCGQPRTVWRAHRAAAGGARAGDQHEDRHRSGAGSALRDLLGGRCRDRCYESPRKSGD
jgi:hypothetical protein